MFALKKRRRIQLFHDRNLFSRRVYVCELIPRKHFFEHSFLKKINFKNKSVCHGRKCVSISAPSNLKFQLRKHPRSAAASPPVSSSSLPLLTPVSSSSEDKGDAMGEISIHIHGESQERNSSLFLHHLSSLVKRQIS